MLPELVQIGEFTLNSGRKSTWKLECEHFTDEGWRGFAALVRMLVPDFSTVYGVPRGGLVLAEHMQSYANPCPVSYKHMPHDSCDGGVLRSIGQQVLIVDDVFTTGGSMTRLRDKLTYPCCEAVRRVEYTTGVLAGGECPIHGATYAPGRFVGAVVFARGLLLPWVKAVFHMPKEFW